MGILFHPPAAALAGCVAQIWHCEDYTLGHAWERIMPASGTTLLVNLADDELRWRCVGGELQRILGLGVCGPQTGPIEIDTAQQRFIMGVEFHPGGAAPITRTAVHELAETHVALEDLIGREARGLHARLVEARSARQRFEILEAWLFERLARAKAARNSAAHAIGLLERMNVAEVGRQMGLAPKRLIQAFRNEVGLTPKRFCRIRRFERLLETIDGRTQIDWARVGAWHGYYDQAHLAHEFRSFSGYSPTEYLALRGPYSRHVPLPE